MQFGEFGVVYAREVGAAELVFTGRRRVVGQVGIFEERVNGIETEAGNAALVPEARDVEHGVFYRGIAPVEVGLLGIKIVVIVLAGFFVEGPGGDAEFRLPIVGRLAVLAIAPDVPIAILGIF